MGTCKFCRRDAGFLRSEHQECRRAHDGGRRRIVEQAARSGLVPTDFAWLRGEIDRIARNSHIPVSDARALVAQGWEQAVGQALDDHVLSQEEEENLLQLMDDFGLSPAELDRDGALTRLQQARVLRTIQEGGLPKVRVESRGLPFNLMKSETLVWVFQDVDYYEQRTHTEYRGGSRGFSFRVARGVYYRTGGFRGERVQTAETVLADRGLLGITTKHLYFAGDSKRFRIRYGRIVAFDPYEDGIGVMRDAQTAKPQTFVTGDGWFVYNLVTALAQG